MQKVYVIAEIGINHNGSENHARKLIDQAYKSGCHAVKFQKRNPDLCVPENQKDLKRETPWGVMTYLEYKWKIEFSVEQYQALREYTKSLGMDFIVSCWDEESVDDIDFKKPPFNQTMAIYVSAGRGRGGAKRRPTKDDHNYMIEEFTKQKYFGSTLQEDKKQEQVIDDGRKEVNKVLDKKEIEILKVQLQNPDLSDRAKSNRQKKLDKLQSIYGEEV